MRPAPRRSSRSRLAAVLLLVLPLAGCVAGTSSGSGTGPATTDEAPIATGTAPPPPDLVASGPATAVGAAPGTVDFSCRTDADCAVKDVGSCCGYSPACVNAASPTFPEQVQAECAKNDMQSTCGFREIEGCACVAGRCEAGPATSGEAVR